MDFSFVNKQVKIIGSYQQIRSKIKYECVYGQKREKHCGILRRLLTSLAAVPLVLPHPRPLVAHQLGQQHQVN